MSKKVLYFSIIISILFGTFIPVYAQSSETPTDSTLNKLQEEVKSLNKEVASLSDELIRITLIVVIAAIFFLLVAAWISRNKAIVNAVNHDVMSSNIMTQALGLPQGTIRGVISIAVVLFFIGFAFFKPDAFIEPIKIITATVIAFYFAKKSSDTMDLVRAIKGEETTTPRVASRNVAQDAIDKAKEKGADKGENSKTHYANALAEMKLAEKEPILSKALIHFATALEHAEQAIIEADKAS